MLRHFSVVQGMTALRVATVVAATTLGCTQGGPATVERPEIDAHTSAEQAVQLLDSSGDGAIDRDELAKCPPLAGASAMYDADKDGRLRVDEVGNRFAQLIGPSTAYVSVEATVMLDRRPLVGATVKLRPIEGFVEPLPPAEGVTDELGTAHPSIPADRLAPEVDGAALVFPGLYHVEITHPDVQLPSRYNTATELGWEIDPNSRSGTTTRFNLKR
jgi:hypothetical protein